MDHRAHLDGYGVHSQFKAVRTDPLPLHGPLLSRDDRTGARACFGRRFRRRRLCMAFIGGSHSWRKIIWWATERAWGKFSRRDDSF